MSNTEHSAQYKSYMKSTKWAKKRKHALYCANNRCARCKKQFPNAVGLEVHHKTYERLGKELPEDLEVLCYPCHIQADKDRALETFTRQRRALANARLNGWATRKYGENWYEIYSYELISEEFDAWLQRRGEWDE